MNPIMAVGELHANRKKIEKSSPEYTMYVMLVLIPVL